MKSGFVPFSDFSNAFSLTFTNQPEKREVDSQTLLECLSIQERCAKSTPSKLLLDSYLCHKLYHYSSSVNLQGNCGAVATQAVDQGGRNSCSNRLRTQNGSLDKPTGIDENLLTIQLADDTLGKSWPKLDHGLNGFMSLWGTIKLEHIVTNGIVFSDMKYETFPECFFRVIYQKKNGFDLGQVGSAFLSLPEGEGGKWYTKLSRV
ncbi:hypothetical protein CSKR_106929 [Clonorchis sinensis]|uniref:Uncharacterized protein n=1 Tax=Clonorchis sinensis TaxID=79923 RepID=A0A3R7CDL7_CLOSI|nr:hypothetical protein CSKR_106929 [Clonorchis sinensis]